MEPRTRLLVLAGGPLVLSFVIAGSVVVWRRGHAPKPHTADERHHGRGQQGVIDRVEERDQARAALALQRPSAKTCVNGVKDPDETDLDCGGVCGACAAGKACREGADCKSGGCVSGVCGPWAKAVAVAANFSCALTSAGSVKCWGSNDGGQLGDGTYRERTSPVDVLDVQGATAIATGGFVVNDFGWACAIIGGALKCWGLNTKGSLGSATAHESPRPVDVPALGSSVAQVALGASHGCVLTTGGAVKCWGSNGLGELGDGTTTRHDTPVDVIGLEHGVTAIASSAFQTCALTDKRAVLCWGNNRFGELGDGTFENRSQPTPVRGLAPATAVSVGKEHVCAVLASGGLACWGHDEYGQVGNRVEKKTINEPYLVERLPPIAAVSAGQLTTCVVTRAGAVICWGHGGDRELGDGKRDDNPEPRVVPTLENGASTSLSMGKWHGCVVTQLGAVKCWGDNGRGELGVGNTTLQSKGPVDVLLSGR